MHTRSLSNLINTFSLRKHPKHIMQREALCHSIEHTVPVLPLLTETIQLTLCKRTISYPNLAERSTGFQKCHQKSLKMTMNSYKY